MSRRPERVRRPPARRDELLLARSEGNSPRATRSTRSDSRAEGSGDLHTGHDAVISAARNPSIAIPSPVRRSISYRELRDSGLLRPITVQTPDLVPVANDVTPDAEPVANDIQVYLDRHCAAEKTLLRNFLQLGNEYAAFSTIQYHRLIGSIWKKLKASRSSGGKNWSIVEGMYLTMEMLVKWSGNGGTCQNYKDNASLLSTMINAIDRIAEFGGLAPNQDAADRALQKLILLHTIPPLFESLSQSYECDLTTLANLIATLRAAEVMIMETQ